MPKTERWIQAAADHIAASNGESVGFCASEKYARIIASEYEKAVNAPNCADCGSQDIHISFCEPCGADMDRTLTEKIAATHEPPVPEAHAPATPATPIQLNVEQEKCVKIWAADDRCWTTQETVEFNLRTFARKILAEVAEAAPTTPIFPHVFDEEPPQHAEGKPLGAGQGRKP